MKEGNTIKLSRLREIGWDLWDPIGLNELEPTWRESAPDEYDGYLLHAVCLIRNSHAREDVVRYLMEIECERMGLSECAGSRERAIEYEALLKAKPYW